MYSYQILDDSGFQKAINIPGYDIDVLNNQMKIYWPGSKYIGIIKLSIALVLGFEKFQRNMMESFLQLDKELPVGHHAANLYSIERINFHKYKAWDLIELEFKKMYVVV